MRLKVSMKIESEEFGITERIVERELPDYGKDVLEDLANTIIDAIPSELFPPFNVLEICQDGEAVGHAEK